MPGARLAHRASIGMLVLAVGACSTTIVEVSGRADAATDYVPGAIYATLNDRYVDPSPARLVKGAPVRLVASPHSYAYGEAPGSMDEYRADPGRWPKILGIAPAGTRIRLEKVELHTYPGLEDWFEVYGVIESGEFGGRKVDLGWISSGVPGSRMLRVNPQELSLVTRPAQASPRP